MNCLKNTSCSFSLVQHSSRSILRGSELCQERGTTFSLNAHVRDKIGFVISDTSINDTLILNLEDAEPKYVELFLLPVLQLAALFELLHAPLIS
jgi:hypothetical protein